MSQTTIKTAEFVFFSMLLMRPSYVWHSSRTIPWHSSKFLMEWLGNYPRRWASNNFTSFRYRSRKVQELVMKGVLHTYYTNTLLSKSRECFSFSSTLIRTIEVAIWLGYMNKNSDIWNCCLGFPSSYSTVKHSTAQWSCRKASEPKLWTHTICVLYHYITL